VNFCLSEAGITIEDLDQIVFYDKPFLKFERLLETYYAFAPKGFLSFAMAMPVWLKEKLFLKQILKKELKKVGALKSLKVPIYFSEHHLSHATSAFFTSPFSRSAFLTVDGVGEWATTSYGIADGEKGIRTLGEMHFPHSLGLLYSSFTYFLGFEVNSGEYKMMGLASYANRNSPRVEKFIKQIKENLIDIKPDGSIRLNMELFSYPTGLKMISIQKWSGVFGFMGRRPDESLEQIHADFALAGQKVLEEVLLKLVRFVKKETGAENLCFAGGVALNCVANAVLFEAKVFDDIYVQPASGDAGGAVGAALAAYYLKKKHVFKGLSKPFNVYLGPRFSDYDMERCLKKYETSYNYVKSTSDLIEATAQYLADNKVVGWFQGRSEFGPRALGNRSILAAASEPDMQQTLNMKIKFREGFRPFAPAVCFEDYETYFEAGKKSDYMLFTSGVKESLRVELPEDFENSSLEEKRKYKKSELPAVTHIDYSARVQVVQKEVNLLFWSLLQQYKSKTGTGVLINTSFNLKDEPIVNSPQDAYLCFMKSGMDVLILGNYIIEK